MNHWVYPFFVVWIAYQRQRLAMDKFSTTGVLLLLILAIIGGYMTGAFAGYIFDLITYRLGRVLAALLNLLFYIVPIWALFSIFSRDGLLLFYLLLLIFYFLGFRDSMFSANNPDKDERHYEPFD